MSPRIGLIPSPFTGAKAWEPVARISRDFIPADYGGVSGPRWYEGVADRVVGQIDDGPWIAALHSGAGGLAPALAAAASNLVGLIFVDAVLPYPGRSWLENAPDELAEQLRRLATDGILTRWNAWFPSDPTTRLIPDEAVRQAFVADLPEVPFAFLEAKSPDVSDWQTFPAAYLQLSRAYEDTAAQAKARGWSTETLKLNHLAMVSEPVAVAERLRAIATQLS